MNIHDQNDPRVKTIKQHQQQEDNAHQQNNFHEEQNNSTVASSSAASTLNSSHNEHQIQDQHYILVSPHYLHNNETEEEEKEAQTVPTRSDDTSIEMKTFHTSTVTGTESTEQLHDIEIHAPTVIPHQQQVANVDAQQLTSVQVPSSNHQHQLASNTIANQAVTAEEEVLECYICKDETKDEPLLMQTCVCHAIVHKSCLDAWTLTRRMARIDECSICKRNFQLVVKQNNSRARRVRKKLAAIFCNTCVSYCATFHALCF